MTLIVTQAYYWTDWRMLIAAPADTNELALALRMAQDIIDAACMHRLKDYSSFPADVQEAVRNAICAQTDYIVNSGGYDAQTEQQETSVTIGKYSADYNNATASNGAAVTSCALNAMASSYLSDTGLLYSGGGAYRVEANS